MPFPRRTLLLGALGVAVASCSTSRAHTIQGTTPAPGRTPAPTPNPTTVPARVAVTSIGVLGDSITVAAKDALTFDLTAAGVRQVLIDAEPNRRIEISDPSGNPASGVRTLEALLAAGASPAAWVVALGTNDVSGYDEEGYAAVIDALLALLPDDVPVVWVDVHRPEFPVATDLFNAVLRRRLDNRGNSTMASWSALAADQDRDLLRDDVHPNADGVVEFAALVTASVAQLVQRL